MIFVNYLLFPINNSILLFWILNEILFFSGNTSTQSSIQIITNNDQKSTGIQTIPTKPHTKSTTEKLPATITQPSTTMKQEASTTVASTSATISNEVIDNCPNLTNVKNLDLLTQEEFSNKLTDSCRYDRLIKPTTKKALDVNIRIDVRHIESADQLVRNQTKYFKTIETWNFYRFRHIYKTTLL